MCIPRLLRQGGNLGGKIEFSARWIQWDFCFAHGDLNLEGSYKLVALIIGDLGSFLGFLLPTDMLTRISVYLSI